MIIKSLKLKKFKLFKDQEIIFDKINIITGENYSGKSTILKGIIFGYYGEASGTALQRLISFGEKETEVELIDDRLHIIRKVPNNLKLFDNNEEKEFNTPTLKQNYINNIIKDYEFFKKYRLINKNSINILDYAKDPKSIVTLRKEIMTFITNQFEISRNNLLAKKLERERFSVDKKLYHFYLSEKRQKILEKNLDRLNLEEYNIIHDRKEQDIIINNLIGEIKGKEKEIYWKNQEKKKLNNGYCPILNSKCSSLNEQLDKVNKEKNQEIEQLFHEIEQINSKLKEEENCMNYYNSLYEDIQNHVRKTKEYLMKLKEAQKFSDYKYTKLDIQLYSDSIKEFDNFAGYYIQQWLNNLSFIINDLLQQINLKIIFSADKQFLTIIENDRELDYNDLSSGQQIFLSLIFKLAILLHNGISEGIIIIDEGINELKYNNLLKLIDIFKILPFQFFLIYQNIDKEIKNVKYINVERKDGVSNVQ